MPRPFQYKPLGDLKGPSSKHTHNRERFAKWQEVSCRECGHEFYQRLVVFYRQRRIGASPICHDCYVKEQQDIEAAIKNLQKKKASLGGVARKLHEKARMKDVQ